MLYWFSFIILTRDICPKFVIDTENRCLLLSAIIPPYIKVSYFTL
jgi:hypothetical protein